MNEDTVCTALGNGREDERNFLFEPPCNCPRCKPELTAGDTGSARWLRVSGRRQRFAVQPMTLGPAGRAMLG